MENLFSIKNCQSLGDYVTAKIPLNEGQLILNEKPLFSFPAESDRIEGWEFACVGCFRTLSSNYKTCEKCLFPICSSSCAENKFHRRLECQVFADIGVPPSAEAYRFLPYVRICLSLKVFQRRHLKFFQLSSEIPESKIPSAKLKEVQQAWFFVNTVCGMSLPMSQAMTIMKILSVNAFDIDITEETGNKYRGIAVYDSGSKFTHCCEPTVEWFLVESQNKKGTLSWNLRFYCKQDIQKGEIVSIAYADRGLIYGTVIRRNIFLKGYPFDCLCSRCMDPTEGGTFLSAHKCRNCKTGHLLPEDPVATSETVWKCSDCSCVETVEKKFQEVITIENDMEVAIQENALDSFFEKHSGKILHPNHFLLVKGTCVWLLTSEFKETLMKQSKKSNKLFKKIMCRYSYCLPLAKRFFTTSEIAQLEWILIDAISAYGFKSDDGKTVNVVFKNPSRKLRLTRLLLQHLTRARFLLEKQPNRLFSEKSKEALNEVYALWSLRCDIYTKELLANQLENEDTVPLGLDSLTIE